MDADGRQEGAAIYAVRAGVFCLWKHLTRVHQKRGGDFGIYFPMTIPPGGNFPGGNNRRTRTDTHTTTRSHVHVTIHEDYTSSSTSLDAHGAVTHSYCRQRPCVPFQMNAAGESVRCRQCCRKSGGVIRKRGGNCFVSINKR